MLRVYGARQLRTSMRKAGGDLEQLKKINYQAAQTVLTAAVPLAPKGKTLRLSGSTRVGATRRAGIIRLGRKSIPYAGPVHWGWPKRGIKARPYVMDAARATEPVWTRQYHTAIKTIIKQVKGL